MAGWLGKSPGMALEQPGTSHSFCLIWQLPRPAPTRVGLIIGPEMEQWRRSGELTLSIYSTSANPVQRWVGTFSHQRTVEAQTKPVMALS